MLSNSHTSVEYSDVIFLSIKYNHKDNEHLCGWIGP